MSNIYRPDTNKVKGVKKIGIRNLRPVNEASVESPSSSQLNLAEVIIERDRLLNEARTQAGIEKAAIEQMRETAHDDIDAMRNAWEAEKAELQQRAYEEAFQVGYEEGTKKSISDMQDTIEKANDTIEMAQKNGQSYLDHQERLILEIAMKSAERILGHALQEDSDLYLSIVKRGLKEVREMREVKVYVSPQYYKLVSDSREELASIFPPDVPMLVFVNDEFEDTECYIETNHGRIVVSIDEQLNEMKERLVELLESEG
ncbi:flagellar assembly protein FliH [Sporosarcina gallistercoris]|uniref:Flagellar assembly protein FliH n=1 Tax=Sporosarcina gallistercoris TaxID=2762245 RepID=A0ABR8PG49_9BACL|nr:flagellar assembly protein FliH [Sporosarcina gallistercoris]MBD7907132.1 flagellar assembly protein FliH [Sporosarcina gallistercoris]